ncbi:MAG: hypothetical protein JXA52_09960, partial [Planctomycetes bacterium]|nr:hypothetical protein [Planctomycetota bacterium]
MKILFKTQKILLVLALCAFALSIQAADLMAPTGPATVIHQPVTPGGGYARQATQATQATQARQATGYVQPRTNLYSGPALQTTTPMVLTTASMPEIPVYSAPKIATPVTIVSTPRVSTGLTGTTITSTPLNLPGVPGGAVPTPTIIDSTPKHVINAPGSTPAVIPTAPSPPMVIQPPTVSIAKPPQEPVAVAPPPSTPAVVIPPSTPSVVKPPDTPAVVDAPGGVSIAAPEEPAVVDNGEGEGEPGKLGEGDEPKVATGGDEPAATGSGHDSGTSRASHEDDEAEKMRKRQESLMLQQMAQCVRSDAEQQAMALVSQHPALMIEHIGDATEQRGMLDAKISEQRERTARLGQLMKQKLMMDDTQVSMLTPASEAVAFTQVWKVMREQVENDVQSEKDKKDQEAKDKIERIRQRIRDMLEKNKQERERRKKDRQRKRNMDKQRELDGRRGELNDKYRELDTERERIENKKKEFEWKDKDAREREQEARKRGDMEEVRRIQAEREQLQKDRYQNMKDETALSKGYDAYQREQRKFHADEKEFQESLDRGEGMSKTEWKDHMLQKERRKLIEKGNDLGSEILKLENKERLPDYELTKTEKQRLEQLRNEYKANNLERAQYDKAIDEVQTELRETQGGTWNELANMTDEQLGKQGERMEKTIAGLDKIHDRIGKGGEQPENSDKFGKQMEGIHEQAGNLNKNYQSAMDRFQQAEEDVSENLANLVKLEESLQGEKRYLELQLQKGSGATKEERAKARERLGEIDKEIAEIPNTRDLNNQHLAREKNAFDIARNGYNKEFNNLTTEAEGIEDDLMLEGINNWANDYNRSYGDTINEDGSVNLPNIEKKVKQLEKFTDLVGDMGKGIVELSDRKTALTQSVDGQPSLADRLQLNPEQIKKAQQQLDNNIDQLMDAQDRLTKDMGEAGYELESRVNDKGEIQKVIIVESNNPLIAAYSQSIDKASHELTGVVDEKAIPSKGLFNDPNIMADGPSPEQEAKMREITPRPPAPLESPRDRERARASEITPRSPEPISSKDTVYDAMAEMGEDAEGESIVPQLSPYPPFALQEPISTAEPRSDTETDVVDWKPDLKAVETVPIELQQADLRNQLSGILDTEAPSTPAKPEETPFPDTTGEAVKKIGTQISDTARELASTPLHEKTPDTTSIYGPPPTPKDREILPPPPKPIEVTPKTGEVASTPVHEAPADTADWAPDLKVIEDVPIELQQADLRNQLSGILDTE